MKTLFMLFVSFILFFSSISYANPDKSDELVNSAWKFCDENNQDKAEKAFLEAIKENENNSRAHLGLTYLYQLQQKFQKSWKYYEKVFETETNYYPYVFAGMMTLKVTMNLENEKSNIVDLYKKLSEECSETTLCGSINEKLGRYYLERNELSKALKYLNMNQAITDWLLIGPFDNISASGFDNSYLPEKEMILEKVYLGMNDTPIKWFKAAKVRHDKWVDMKRHFPGDPGVFYGNTFVFSEKKQTVQLRLGTSGALKVFLNDNLVYSYRDENNNDLDTYIVETELQEGWNRLLLKCSYSEITQCNFYARIADKTGKLLQNLKISSNVKNYNSNTHFTSKEIRNFAEKYFEEKIEQYPDHLENYLLLADCYLRNDKAIEAELILRKAIEKSPKNAMLYTHLIEAYIRGEKYDEMNSTYQKIYDLDQNIPTVIIKKFNQYIDNQNFSKAKEMLDKLQALLPESLIFHQLRIIYYSKQEITDKIIEYVDIAYELFPNIWDIVQTKSILTVYIKKNFDEALDILEEYLEKHTNNVAFYTITDFYLKASKFDQWEETLTDLIEFYPAATGYYYQAATTYFAVQDFSKALKFINLAIEMCPTCSDYWEKRAEIERSMKNLTSATASYENSLIFRPTQFSARDKLRELQNKLPIFSHFKFYKIDSLIKNAPSSEDYPDDNAVILLSDLKRVVYDRGASETNEEVLIKMFNDDGIDAFKEYYIGYNSYTEALTVERAVTIKQDGSEIEADQNGGSIVFKSLEENDLVYIKWKIRNYYSGKLSNHFWDSFYFNVYYPVKIAKYSLLAPEDYTYNVKGQNMPDQPTFTRKTDDGLLSSWEMTNLESIKGEYNMPGLEDIGIVLYLSSIPDWKYIIDWYSDLARTKTESSYEITETVENLFKNKKNASELEKIQTIYQYITENIRYSSVSFRQSAHIPQQSRDVLVTKIGDCKDKTALAISMLKEVGIEANYILLNTNDEGLNKYVLPSIAFNHAIAGIKSEQGNLYLDLTAQNYPMFSTPRSNLGAFALEISPESKDPFYIPLKELKRGNKIRKSKVMANPDNSILVENQTTRTYMQSAYTRNFYRHMSQKDRMTELTEVISQSHPNVELLKFEIQDIDQINPVLHYEYSYNVPNYITDAGGLKLIKIPWADNLEPRKSLSYESRKYDYNYWPTADTIRQEIEIQLPEGYSPLQLNNNIQYSSDVADYSVKLNYKDGILYGTREYINKKWTVPPEIYKEFKEFYNNALKADETQIVLTQNN